MSAITRYLAEIGKRGGEARAAAMTKKQRTEAVRGRQLGLEGRAARGRLRPA